MKSSNYLFKWQGKNKHGQKISGEIRASSLTLAKNQLIKRGIQPTKISPPSLLSQLTTSKIKFDSISSLINQLASILESGIPLIQAFELLGKSQTQGQITQLIDELKFHVESGSSLADAFNQYPEYFNDYFCSLIEAGESSGTLDQMLKDLVKHREKIGAIKRKIKKTMIYPIIVISVAIIVSAILLIFVIPKFQSIYASYGAQLPTYTLMVIELSKYVQNYWWITLLACFGFYFGAKILYKKQPRIHYIIDKMVLKLPILGTLIQKSIYAKFAQAMSITFAAGLSLYDALKLIKNGMGNQVYIEAIESIRKNVSSGQSLNESMAKTKLFPIMMIQMIAIGEQTGNMEEMLSKLAHYYEQEVDSAVDTLNTLLEPLILMILGLIVGSLVIAMYLPMFKLTTLM